MTDVIVIGAGLNGLVAGAALAKRKLSVVILDRQDTVGGAAITAEFAPGYRAPVLSHALGPISRDVVRDLRLDRVGLEFMTADPALTAFSDDGRALVFHRDAVLTAASINAFSPADAGRWADFTRTVQRAASLVSQMHRQAPPALDGDGRRDWWRFLSLGRQARALGGRHLAQLARWIPMPVADLAAEWFESDVLRAAIAAQAVFGHPAGPRSPGTGGLLVGRIAADPMPMGSGATVRGGPGALTAAIARIATERGASVLTNTRVARILVEDGRAAGVALDNGDTMQARAVVAAVSPKHALVDLVEPMELPPSFLERMRHVRARGVTAKINIALDGLPPFTALGGDTLPLSGRLLIAPTPDYIERAFDAAKYGALPDRPWLEVSIPTVRDASLAPANGHVMSVYAHFAPRHLRGRSWAAAREDLSSAVMRVLEAHAPTIGRHVVAREVLTPADLEARWGLSGGHIFHGELSLDQTWAARPLLGWANYRTPVAGLYLASAGTHPGGGLTGLPGWLASQTILRDLKK